MSSLSAVVGYLADIADVDAARSFVVDGVVFTGVELGTTIDHPALDRLKSVDRLHREEHLLSRGRLWIVGEIDGTRYRWPIERQRLRVGRRGRIEPADGWTMPAGPVQPPALTELALDMKWGEADLIGHASPAELEAAPIGAMTAIVDQLRVEARADVEAFVRAYLHAARLPEDLPIIGGTEPPPSSQPAVMAATGYFLDFHPFETNRASVLKLWKGADLDRTVLRELYGVADESVSDTGAEESSFVGDTIHSPLPLNAGQRRAVLAARDRPLTVVSGPPGTGKSHLVAATAIDQVAAGRSVLIATQSLHAAEVVTALLDRHPMIESLRFGDPGSVRRLSDRLAAGVPAPDDRHDPDGLRRRFDGLAADIAEHRKRLHERIDQIAAFERALVRRHDVPLWLASRDLSTIDVDALRRAVADRTAPGLFAWNTRRRARAELRSVLGNRRPPPEEILAIADSVAADQLVTAIAGRQLGLDELWIELDRLEQQWRSTLGDLLEAERRRSVRSTSRKSVQQLASALRLGPRQRRHALLSMGSEFLQVVPLWIGTLGEIETVLPVEAALFDLVVLDEASQISQLSAVPALARARRAMIVGDSRQLRHVSFVSNEAQASAARARGLPPELAARLDDRANSTFDVAAGMAPVIELVEHFRSAPHIIGFSDRTFYDGRLRLMTQHPRNESRDAIEVVTVSGSRDDSGVVRAEVAEVVTRVRDLVDAGRGSIGVVSPFRAQADAIEAALLDGFRLDEIDRHQLRVGTVHGFQGTERDHVIVSIGAGPADTGARRFFEDPAIFNVMVTRARNHVVVVTCLDRRTAGNGLLGRYLRHADEPPSPRCPQVHATGWTERLARELADQAGVRVITDYEVAGETIDIVVGSDGDAFGIETEVHPGGPARHVDRRLALQRAGWQIISLHRSSCYGREEEAIAELLGRLARRR